MFKAAWSKFLKTRSGLVVGPLPVGTDPPVSRDRVTTLWELQVALGGIVPADRQTQGTACSTAGSSKSDKTRARSRGFLGQGPRQEPTAKWHKQLLGFCLLIVVTSM